MIIVIIVMIGFWCVFYILENVFGDMGVIVIIFIVFFFGVGIFMKEDFNNFFWIIIIFVVGGLLLGKVVNFFGLLYIVMREIMV